MKKPFFLAAVALLPLAACDQSSTPVAQNTEAATNTAPAVALPPSITKSASLRCDDGSLVYVDFFEGDTQINVRSAPDSAPIHLTAPAKGQPFAGNGYEVSGTAKSVEYTQPGKKKQTCKA
jgi:hypothetical protein